MNESVISGKWKEIKGEIKKTWGNLTDDEIDQAQGNVESLAGTIQKKFGLAKEEASERLNKIFRKFDSDDSEADFRPTDRTDSTLDSENLSTKI